MRGSNTLWPRVGCVLFLVFNDLKTPNDHFHLRERSAPPQTSLNIKTIPKARSYGLLCIFDPFFGFLGSPLF